MIYQGKVWQCSQKEGIAELKIDSQSGANVFNTEALSELREAVDALKKESGVKGLIITSGKDHFIFGADITEFLGHFKKTDAELSSWLTETNNLFNEIEDLPYPSVTAINGFALGGGLEVCLSTDFRVAYDSSRIGLPETKLGLIPGWGGTVRLSRIAGADNAIEWIASGKQYKSIEGFKIGVIDGVVEKGSDLKSQGLTLLERAINNELDWKKKREQKKSPLLLNKTEAGLVFEGSKGFIAAQAGPNYPAPVNAVMAIAEGSTLKREDAIAKETKYFVACARTSAASSLINVFLGDQYLKKTSKKISKGAGLVESCAVLGAGIMGGGISYQSASRGIPTLMKDINKGALDLGLAEASSLLKKQNARGKISVEQVAHTMGMINTTLHYGEMVDIDFVTEAVVENLDIKKKVLSELEDNVSEDTVIASNTSTLSISEMGKGLKRPEKFCGLHFFNPVHRMPLVEVVRGEKTSEETIAKAVSYAVQLGKTPIVVNDCEGFLVNRVLFPYFLGFTKLIEEGEDFRRIDKVMEKFGWPMGPAYLLDVVGIDTADHCIDVIGKAYGDRMEFSENNIINLLYKSERYGQKNGNGFYKYEKDRKGKLKKIYDESIEAFIEKAKKGSADLIDEEIVDRMMFPMLFEAVRCLEDKIVQTHREVDMGLLLGLGFPPFRVGALKYADDLGLDEVIKRAEKYSSLGELYQVPELLKEKAKNNSNFYEGA